MGRCASRDAERPTIDGQKNGESLLEAELPLLECPLLEEDFLQKFCGKKKDRNEVKVLQDIF